MDIQTRPNLKSLIKNLKAFTGKTKNSDLLYHILSNFQEEKEKRIEYQNKVVLLETRLQYAENLLTKKGLQ